MRENTDQKNSEYRNFFTQCKVSQVFARVLNTPQTLSKAVTRTCSVKKAFLEILQNSQENASFRVSFLTIFFDYFGLQLYLKRDSGIGVFL